MTDLPASRRAVFAGAGAVGIAGVLGACGGDETPTEASPTSTNTRPPTPKPATTTGPPAKFAVKKSDIPVGGGKIFGEDEVVITQPTAGNFVGLSAICTHQQCIVAKVENKKIICGCHGSEYNFANGSVLKGPASKALPKKALTVESDSIGLA